MPHQHSDDPTCHIVIISYLVKTRKKVSKGIFQPKSPSRELGEVEWFG